MYSVFLCLSFLQAQPILFGVAKVALFFELTKFSHAKNTIICCITYFPAPFFSYLNIFLAHFLIPSNPLIL